jgi:hypothetical protein
MTNKNDSFVHQSYGNGSLDYPFCHNINLMDFCLL